MSRSEPDAAVVAALAALVEPLNRALAGPTEVVLHDLARLPNSIVAISGQVTGRKPGGPATDMLLRAAVSGNLSTMVGYEARLADGRRVRSSTIVVNGQDGNPMATLCVNADVTLWEPVRDFVQAVLPGGHWPGRRVDDPPVEPDSEHFAGDIDSLASHLLTEAVGRAGVPVHLMRKSHKVEVVRQLQSKGYFLLREAVDRCAEALDVTRYTVYNYLNEINEAPGPAPDGQGRTRTTA